MNLDFIYIADWTQMDRANYETYDTDARVAEVGSLSTGAKIAIKIFVWRVIAIFAISASFSHVVTNLQN